MILRVENLTKIYGDEKKALTLLEKGLSKKEIFKLSGANVALNNVSFSVKKGEIFVIAGLSGSGKSTALRLINKLINPTSGKVFVQDVNVYDLNAKDLRRLRRKKISMVFQSFALMPHLNVLENVAFGLEIDGMKKAQRTSLALEAIAQVGLEHTQNLYPKELSGGMSQRVAIARALINDPEIILMDEAFSALDPLLKTKMQDELLEMQQKYSKTIIFITHDINEAIKLGDKIALMQDGQIAQIDTAFNMLNSPATPYVQKFFSSVNLQEFLCAKNVLSDDFIMINTTDKQEAISILRQNEKHYGFVKLQNSFGIIFLQDLINNAENFNNLIKTTKPIQEDEPLKIVIQKLLKVKTALLVVDKNNQILGVAKKTKILKTLSKDNDAK